MAEQDEPQTGKPGKPATAQAVPGADAKTGAGSGSLSAAAASAAARIEASIVASRTAAAQKAAEAKAPAAQAARPAATTGAASAKPATAPLKPADPAKPTPAGAGGQILQAGHQLGRGENVLEAVVVAMKVEHDVVADRQFQQPPLQPLVNGRRRAFSG